MHRGPAYENLQGRKPRESERGPCRALDLWRFESGAQSQGPANFNRCRPRLRAQPKRYGTEIAKWGFVLSPRVEFQRVRCGKNVASDNFYVMSIAASFERHTLNPKTRRLNFHCVDLLIVLVKMIVISSHRTEKFFVGRISGSSALDWIAMSMSSVMRRRNRLIASSVTGMLLSE